MTSVYNKLISNPQKLFVAVVALLLLGATLWLQPTVKARLFPNTQKQQLQSFIQQIETSGAIDAQAFWQFRAEYSPGFFTINPKAVELGQTYQLKSLPSNKTLLLTYQSPQLLSYDYVTTTDTAKTTVARYKAANKIIWQTENSLLIDEDNQWRLVFHLPTTEMQKANGFFNYTSHERELLENRRWLNETIIYQ